MLTKRCLANMAPRNCTDSKNWLQVDELQLLCVLSGRLESKGTEVCKRPQARANLVLQLPE